MEKLRVYSDVAINPEYKFAGFGIIIATPKGEVIREITEGAGQISEMETRYRAIIAAIEEVVNLGAKQVEIITSSRELVQNILKKDEVEKKELKALYQEFKRLRGKLDKVKIGFLSYGDDALMRRAYIGAVSGANPEEHKQRLEYSVPAEQTELVSQEIECPQCHKPFSSEWQFCPLCGTKKEQRRA